MTAGSWQGWQWDQGKWDTQCQEVEHELSDVTRVGSREGILDVSIG